MKDSQFSNSSSKSSQQKMEGFGLYIHIPYCLQKCHYCDFVKFEVNELPPLNDYIKLLFKELEHKTIDQTQKIKSLYFGGGTPSLLSLKQFEEIISKVKNIYQMMDDPEVTIEINPGTLTKSDFLRLKDIGVNRYSLGIQTFNPLLLNACGRKHSPKDSFTDLENLNDLGINFSADLLFGLPNQTTKDLNIDLDHLLKYSPPHVSPYNLTLPSGHFFNKNRPADHEQVEMMDLITHRLEEKNIFRYEVSNYAREGFEAVHNRGYWEDREYLGLGMGAHSYFKNEGWGVRTWNSGNYKKYEACVHSDHRPHQRKEFLKIHEALTDYCHTSLRQKKGMKKESLILKFGQSSLPESLWSRLSKLVDRFLLYFENGTWSLTSTGFEIPNEVFRELCFLKEDFHD